MGGTVTDITTRRRSTAAEDTSAILRQGQHDRLPILIPGALEPRVKRPSAPHTGGAVLVTPHPPAAAADDRGRLAREREGGGAPSQRMSRRTGTVSARVWHALLHPSDFALIWRPSLPQLP
jgi:hypothetical protein